MQTTPESASPSWADGHLAAFGLTPAALTNRIKECTVNLRPRFFGCLEFSFDKLGTVRLHYVEGQIVHIEMERGGNGTVIRETVRKQSALDLRKLAR